MARKRRVKHAQRIFPVETSVGEADGFIITTLDVYHAPNLPPSSPDLQATGRIREIYSQGRDLDQGATTNVPSHVLVVGLDVDIRDGDMEIGQAGDKVYLPDQDGTQFEVYAVVRRKDERWCYCRRKQRVSGAFTPY